MELEILNTALKSQLSEDIYAKLVSQIEKDFIMSGIEYNFSDLKPQELINALHEILEELLSKEYAALLNLLYRMDIPESAIKLQETEDIQSHLVNLILRREFLKVQMRQKYSN